MPGSPRGGATGDAGGSSLAETAARSERHFALARQIKPDVILLAHGAAIVEPEDAQYMLDHTGCHGVQLGSSIERLAIEVRSRRARRPSRRPGFRRPGLERAPMTRVPLRQELIADAERGGYAVGYFESWSLESLLAIADAAEAARSPVILGFSGIYLPHPERRARDPLAPYFAMAAAVADHVTVPTCLLFNESPASRLGARSDLPWIRSGDVQR